MTPFELKDGIEKLEGLRVQKEKLENNLHKYLKERILTLNTRYDNAHTEALALFPKYAIYTTCYGQKIYSSPYDTSIDIGTPEKDHFTAVLSYSDDRDGETFMWQIEVPFDEANDDKFIEDFKSDCIREYTAIYERKKAQEKKNAEAQIAELEKELNNNWP